MREYQLADSIFKNSIDLRDFKKEIQDAVAKHTQNVTVYVEKDRYILDKNISKGDAIRIGRTLAAGPLGQYCLLRATLFSGHTIKENINHLKSKQTKS